jgi:hypothetical protein
MSDFPMHAWPQHHYPQLRGYKVDEDGEVTTHLCLGLPCCGFDLLIEHPPTMTALELYAIASKFCQMHRRVKTLGSFNSCQLLHDSAERPA